MNKGAGAAQYRDTISSTTPTPTPRQASLHEYAATNRTLVEINTNLDMQRHVEEFNRTITIILWYKAGLEPIRLQQMIPTFPYFQLLRLASLVTDLGLTAGSYLDTYDPRSGKWEQHTISTVRVVEGQQRLLYRIRKSLFEGIPETDCLSLSEEVQSQSPPRRSSILPPPSPPGDTPKNDTLKRAAPEQLTPPGKVHIPNNYYKASPPSSASAGSSSTPAPSPTHSFDTTSDAQSPTTNQPPPPPPNPIVPLQHAPTFYPPKPSDLPQYLINPQSSTTTIPYHPHPPLKRWPNDYTVSELTAGFHAMETLIAQSPTGDSLTQRAAFERVFGSRYVKSTMCRHRGVWRKAQGPLRERFEAMGNDEGACWGEFVRRFEGRPSSKSSVRQRNRNANGNGEVRGGALGTTGLPPPPSSGGVMLFVAGSGPGSVSRVAAGDGVQPPSAVIRREEEKNVDERPIMDSLQKP